MMKTKVLFLFCFMTATTSAAFNVKIQSQLSSSTSLFGVSLDKENNSNNRLRAGQKKTAGINGSTLLDPKETDDSSLVGNWGFDPLGLAQTNKKLQYYREAEVKHGRLAMVATALILGTELYDRVLADYWGLDLQLVEYDEETMLLLNLDRTSPTLWGFLLGCMAAIELYGSDRRTTNGKDYFAGNLGFDPAGWYPQDKAAQRRMQAGEIHNGRLAMVGFAFYLYQVLVLNDEYVPFLFRSWWEV